MNIESSWDYNFQDFCHNSAEKRNESSDSIDAFNVVVHAKPVSFDYSRWDLLDEFVLKHDSFSVKSNHIVTETPSPKIETGFQMEYCQNIEQILLAIFAKQILEATKMTYHL